MAHEIARLTPKQEAALAELVEGKNNAEAARAVGCRRETVSRWRHHDEAFALELARRQGELEADRRRAVLAEQLATVRYLATVRDDPAQETRDRIAAARKLADLGAPQGGRLALEATAEDGTGRRVQVRALAEDAEARALAQQLLTRLAQAANPPR